MSAGLAARRSGAAPAGARTRQQTSRHGPIAQLLIAWSPLSAILLAYALAEWLTAPLGMGDGAASNRLGFHLHTTGPVLADTRVFGTVPTVWLQARLVDGSPHWYDAVAALVYATHFVSIPVVTGLVWFHWRDRFKAWIASVLAFITLGVAGYVVYPAAPPWLASDRGEIGTVDRISSLGWEWLHLDSVGRLTDLGQAGSNPVAAMPSLHAGAAVLITLFAWPLVSSLARAALLGYALAMAATLVYTGEHYVVDVVAGGVVAGVAVGVAAVVGSAVRRRADRRSERGPGSPPDWAPPGPA